MKTKLFLLYSLISIFSLNNATLAQNCPGYSTTVTSPSVTCGNQPYYFQVANTACNGTISFTILGNYGSSFANEITWIVTSNLTGATIASGGPGTNNGAINVSVGPLNPAVTGNYFTLVVNDVFGDGFNGLGGTISITQSGSTIVGPITGNFGAQSSTIFGANINISPVTVTINTPAGPVTTIVNNCEPVNVPLTLQNNAFCSPTTVNLPWTITCNSTGAVLASGTKAVTVYPKIPTAASDLVQVTWNAATCSWNVSPQNGCVSANIGTIFTISPNPATLPAPVCGGGSQAFSVSYNGISGGPNCCSTGGPLVPITYAFTDNTPTALSTPFGGTNNGALLTIPAANNNGGNATAVTLNVNMSGYCFNPPGTATNTSYWVTIYQNNTILLDQQSVAVGPANYNTTLNLTQIPGYNASSAIIVYIYPNAFNSTTAGVTTNTTFVQGIACPPTTDGNWTASSINATLSATYQNLTTSLASCVYPIAPQSYSCCPFTTVPNATGVICAGGSLASLTTWQSAVSAANANCVVYSSVLPVAGTTLPNNTLPNGINSTSSAITQTVNAYSYCDVDGSGTINSGDTYSLISSFTLTVNPTNSISLTSAAATENQTLCITNPLVPITYSTTGATGATFTGLPAGVSGTWNNNTISISGTPTQTGSFNYTITLTGGCGSISTSGSITISVSNTISLTSAAATTNQTLCDPNAIANITYTTTGASGATFTGLPTGVTGNWNNNTITISGTPSQTGTFNYTISLTGGCGNQTATGTLVINPLNTITLSSAVSTINQTLCSSSPITNITYTTTGATGASFAGLPAGVVGSWNNNTLTISGTSSQTGTYAYTITLTGGCGLITATGTITITQGNTLTLTSAASTTNQIICSPNPITTITYATSGATGATFTGLPTGVTGTWNNNAISISGTPTQTGTFNYSISLSGGCGNPTAGGTITFNNQTTPNFNQISAICSGASISLPSTSLNNISGVWSPQVNNLATTLYTFTPNINECATTATTSITVTPNTTPTFNQVLPLCSGIGFTLPTTSLEGIAGNWSPPINVTSTTSYTFTPSSAVCTLPANMSVTILPLPIVNAGNDLSVCNGAQATLSGSGAQAYSWTGGVNDLVAFTPTSTTTYTVTGTSVDGCIGTDQVNINVNPIPNVNAGNDVTVCSNATVVLTGSGAANYSWNNGVQNGVAFTPPSGTTNYIVTGTSAAGCIASDNLNVTVINSLSVSFTPDVTTGCTPLTVNFTNNSLNGVNCLWSMGNGDVINGCGSISYTFTNPQCYDISLTVTDAAGCSGTSTLTNLICVESNPTASFIASDYTISELNNVVQFNNQSAGATNYSWNFGDNSSLSSLVNPDHTFPLTEEGNYTVTLTAISDFGCIGTTQANIQVFEELIFYVPNTFTPDNDDFNQMFKPIFTSGFDPFDYTLLIFNRWGELVFESHDSEIGWLGTYGTGGEMKYVEDGTYTWTIEFKTSKSDERKVVRGHINLLR